jgi:hypothetical protein
MEAPVLRASSCLGHAEERTEEITCARCGGVRWLLLPNAEPVSAAYTCRRCRAGLAGANVIDPGAESASPAQRAARAGAAGRLRLLHSRRGSR